MPGYFFSFSRSWQSNYGGDARGFVALALSFLQRRAVSLHTPTKNVNDQTNLI
jgi:hypothetical protein